MLNATLATQFVLAAAREDIVGHGIVIETLDRLCPDEGAELKQFDATFGERSAQGVIQLVKLANMLKHDFYAQGVDIPDHVYEYLASYRIIDEYPELFEKLSPRAQAIACELEPFFNTSLKHSDMPSNVHATFAGTIRALHRVAAFQMHVKLNIGTPQLQDDQIEEILIPAVAFCQHNTDAAYQLNNFINCINNHYNLHDHPHGWYMPFARDHIGPTEEHSLGVLDKLGLPDCIIDGVKGTYLFLEERHGATPYDTFVYLSKTVLRPLQEVQSLYENPDQLQLASAMISFAQNDEEFLEFFEEAIAPDIMNMYRAFRTGENLEECMTRSQYKCFQEGELIYQMTQIQDLMAHLEGRRRQTFVMEDDVKTFHGVLLSMPAVIGDHDPCFKQAYYELRSEALAVHNRVAPKYDIPVIPDVTIPHCNDNGITPA